MKLLRYGLKLLVLLSAVCFLIGCGGEQEYSGLSSNVKKLWEDHPSPWSVEEAQAAADAAKKVLNKHPEDIQVEFYYQDRMNTADRETLRKEYSDKAENNPDNPRIILLNAMVAGRSSNVQEMVEKAINLAPEDAYVLAMAAYLVSRTSQEKAAEYARRAVSLDPEIPITRSVLAQAELLAGNFEQAEVNARVAFETNPYDFNYARILVSIYESGTDPTDADQTIIKVTRALDVLEHFLVKNPNHPGAIRAISRRYRSLGNLSRVLELKKPAALERPDEGWALYDLAELYAEMNQPDSCIRYLSVASDEGFNDYHLVQIDVRNPSNPFNLLEKYWHVSRGEGNPFADDPDLVQDQNFAVRITKDFKSVIQKMKNYQKDTVEERRAEVLSERLDIPAPDFSCLDTEGNEFNLTDLRGKVVVLDFWATWCGPCRMAIPRLHDLYKDRIAKSGDIELLSVNVWERARGEKKLEMVKKFTTDEKLKWPVLLAEDSVAEDYKVMGIPTFVIIDADGVVRYSMSGYMAFLDETLGWMIDAAGSPGLASR